MQSSPQELPFIWLPGIVDCIAQFLDPNEVSCTLRLLIKATAQQFADRAVVRLSQPVPHHAFRYKWDNDQIMRAYNLRKRRKFVALTAASSCLPNLELAVQRAGIKLTHPTDDDPLSAAAAAGHIHICEWLNQRGYPKRSVQLVATSRAGRQDVCAWLLNNDCPWRRDAVCAAARCGHRALVTWLLTRKPDRALQVDSISLIQAAAEGCDLATLQELYGEWQPNEIVDHQFTIVLRRSELSRIWAAAAARSPMPDWQDKVKWLEAKGIGNPRDALVCLETVRCSNALERLTWLQERGYPVDVEVVMSAAECGNLAVLRMLLDAGVTRHDQYTASRAAVRGQLAALKVLHDYGRLGDPTRVLQSALSAGELEVVDGLVQELGLGLDGLLQKEGRELVHMAAQEGNIAMLEWLHERGCRVKCLDSGAQTDPDSRSRKRPLVSLRGSKEVFEYAAEGGCDEVIEWLLAHGYNFPSAGQGTSYRIACMAGDLGTLACLHRLGCEWDGRMEVDVRDLPRGVWAWIEQMKLPRFFRSSCYCDNLEVEETTE